MCEIVHFCAPNLTKLKEKSRKTAKCHNIFTIPLFSVVVNFGLIYYYLFYRNVISIIFSKKILNDKLLLILKWTND